MEVVDSVVSTIAFVLIGIIFGAWFPAMITKLVMWVKKPRPSKSRKLTVHSEEELRKMDDLELNICYQRNQRLGEKAAQFSIVNPYTIENQMILSELARREVLKLGDQ